MKRYASIFCFFCILFLLGAGCSLANTHSWTQELTIVVATPDGEVSGSSVTRIKAKKVDWGPLQARGVTYRVSGEAVMVELAPGRYLFALLQGMDTLAWGVFPQYAPSRDFDSWAGGLSDFQVTDAIVPQRSYPVLVTFDDIDDPTSIKRVEPDDLAATFGEGFALKEMRLSVNTVKRQSAKLESVLTWHESVGGGMLDGRKFSSIDAPNRLANDLSWIDFKRK